MNRLAVMKVEMDAVNLEWHRWRDRGHQLIPCNAGEPGNVGIILFGSKYETSSELSKQ